MTAMAGRWWDAHGPGTVAILNTGSVATELLPWVRLLPPMASLYMVRGHEIARQRNMSVHALGERDWLLFVDSDCVPPPDGLERLLETGLPLVSGVVLERYPPFVPTAVRSFEPPARWRLCDIPRTGTVPVPAVGAGFLLIRKVVFDTMEQPWFRCGQIEADRLSEDMEFCLRAAEAGFPPMLACAVRVGHRVSDPTVWPGLNGLHWFQWIGPGEAWTPMRLEADPVAEPSGRDRDGT